MNFKDYVKNIRIPSPHSKNGQNYSFDFEANSFVHNVNKGGYNWEANFLRQTGRTTKLILAACWVFLYKKEKIILHYHSNDMAKRAVEIARFVLEQSNVNYSLHKNKITNTKNHDNWIVFSFIEFDECQEIAGLSFYDNGIFDVIYSKQNTYVNKH